MIAYKSGFGQNIPDIPRKLSLYDRSANAVPSLDVTLLHRFKTSPY